MSLKLVHVGLVAREYSEKVNSRQYCSNSLVSVPVVRFNARAKPLDISRAEDPPEETLDRILYFVANDSYHGSGGIVNKEGLCSCSLVCQYWSKRTIPALFDTLSDRSSEDGRDF